MNTPLGQDHENLRYAEYVLGVLDADERAAVEDDIAKDPRAAGEVAWWQQRLMPLAEDVASATPPGHVWTRIQDALGASPRRAAPPPASLRHGFWDSLALWRWIASGAGAIAAACIVALVVLPRASVTPGVRPATYMASTITQANGQVGWTATVDLQHARMIVVPATPQSLPVGRAPELWLIPAGQKPIAVGMIASDAPTAIKLDPALLARLGPTAALAVSIEPPGGSPTGQPTGPVIGKGAIGAAKNRGGKSVAMLQVPANTDNAA